MPLFSGINTTPLSGEWTGWQLIKLFLIGATCVLASVIFGIAIANIVNIKHLHDDHHHWGDDLAEGDGQIFGAHSGGKAGLCLDPSDTWPANEFPTRDTDVLAATFCTRCRSSSQPKCTGSVCRADFVEFESYNPTVTQPGPSTQITVNALGYYRFQILLTATTACPVRKIEVALWDEINNMQLGESVLVNSFAPTELFVDRIIEADTYVSVRVVDPSNKDRLAAYGRVLRSTLLDALLQQTFFDANTKVQWIPDRPASLPPPPPAIGSSPLFPGQYPNDTVTYPWFSPVIPAAVLTPPLPTLAPPLPPLQAVPNADGHSKFQSVPTSLDTYFARDTFNDPSTDPALTLFQTALEDRGLDTLGRRNHLKTEYMTALTAERVLLYVPKMQAFVNRVYSLVVTNDLPLLSTFKDELIEFFLDVHWGHDEERPQFVRDYFRLFIDIVGFGDPTLPGRNEAFMFGADNSQAVRDYARTQTIKVISERDTTAIVYWWNLGGLPDERQLTEAVHNIVAFSQFNHHLFLVIRDAISGTPFPPPLPPNIQYNFLGIYASLPTDEAKLNLIRESYRILLPNGNDFSRVKEANPSGETVQSRHLRLPIQIAAHTVLAGGDQTAGAIDFLTLDLSRYDDPVLGDDYNTNFTSNNCPELSEDSDFFYPELQFNVSDIDGETLVDLCNPKLFPVFKLLKYYPFGAGYRRCAGEAFNMIFTKLIFDRFINTPFEFRNITNPDPVTLAPFVFAPDTIFFNKSTVVVP